MNKYETGLLIYMIIVFLIAIRQIYLIIRKKDKLREQYLLGATMCIVVVVLPLFYADISLLDKNIHQIMFSLFVEKFQNVPIRDRLNFLVDVAFFLSAFCYFTILFGRTVMNKYYEVPENDCIAVPFGGVFIVVHLMIPATTNVIQSWYMMTQLWSFLAYFYISWYYVDIKFRERLKGCIRRKRQE